LLQLPPCRRQWRLIRFCCRLPISPPKSFDQNGGFDPLLILRMWMRQVVLPSPRETGEDWVTGRPVPKRSCDQGLSSDAVVVGHGGEDGPRPGFCAQSDALKTRA